jgi:hypothetical protein
MNGILAYVINHFRTNFHANWGHQFRVSNWYFYLVFSINFAKHTNLCIEKTQYIPKAIPLPASRDAGKNATQTPNSGHRL